MPDFRARDHLPIAGVLLFAGIGIYLCYWICDDAYISYRYARNLVEKQGLVFNPGVDPPVEGYSNLLWVLIVAAVEFAGLKPYAWMPVVSGACGLYLVARVFRFLRRELSISHPVAAAFTAILALSPPFLVWSTSGLATMPFALLVFWLFEIAVAASKQIRVPETICVTVALCLVRAEGFAWAVCIGILGLLFGPHKRHILRVIVPTIILVTTAHFLFRYAYYGDWLPQTASAKVAFSIPRLMRGIDYIAVFMLTFITPAFAVLALLRIRDIFVRPIILASGAMAVGFAAYSILTGGDFMAMGRFLVPALAFVTVLFAVVLNALRPSLATAACVLIVGVTLLPLANVHLVPHDVRSQFHFRLNTIEYVSEREQWENMTANALRWRRKGEYLETITTPDQSLVAGAIGAVGYFSKMHIYDRRGLVTRIPVTEETSRLASPGHDILVPLTYFEAEAPTYLFAEPYLPSGLKWLVKNRENFPYPYAPEVHEVALFEGLNMPLYEHFRHLVLMKRQPDRKSYEKTWDALRQWNE